MRHPASYSTPAPSSIRKEHSTPAWTARSHFAPYVPPAGEQRRWQSLDGLRAIAIVLVLFNHASVTRGFPALLTVLTHDPYFGLAGHGVKLFFVISGFLITSVLLRELDRKGTIDVRAFFARRSRRIFPAYFTYLFIVGLMRLGGLFAFDSRPFLVALTFSGAPRTAVVGHLWSMAVQEQFYVIWPLILVAGGRRFASYCAFAALLIVPIARVILTTFAPDATSLYLTNAASVDTLALGCLLALHRDRLATRRWFTRLVESRYCIPLLFVVAGCTGLVGWRVLVLLQTPVLGLAMALLLERCIRRPNGGFGRLLNSRCLVYVGSASFSLYLWQQLFLNPHSTWSLAAYPVNIVFAIAIGLLSWHLVERRVAARRRFPWRLAFPRRSQGVPLSSSPTA